MMMNRIYLAFITIVVVLGIAGFATYAAWSDSVTVTNNQIQSGTADLQVSTNNGTTWNTTTSASSFSVSGLIPGGSESAGYVFSLKNESSSGVTFNTSGQISSVAGAGSDESQLEIAVYETGSSATDGSGWISLSDWQSSQRTFNSSLSTGVSNVKHYQIAARLKSTATNDWQSKTVGFTLTVNGQQ